MSLEDCSCGRNHLTEGVGECDVPALAAENAALKARVEELEQKPIPGFATGGMSMQAPAAEDDWRGKYRQLMWKLGQMALQHEELVGTVDQMVQGWPKREPPLANGVIWMSVPVRDGIWVKVCVDAVIDSLKRSLEALKP